MLLFCSKSWVLNLYLICIKKHGFCTLNKDVPVIQDIIISSLYSIESECWLNRRISQQRESNQKHCEIGLIKLNKKDMLEPTSKFRPMLAIYCSISLPHKRIYDVFLRLCEAIYNETISDEYIVYIFDILYYILMN